jgi:hypothetical protein
MSGTDSKISFDEMIKQKKRELAKMVKLQRLAAELNVVVGAPPDQPVAPIPASATTPKSPSRSPDAFDGTVAGLVKCYRNDKRSTYYQLKFAVRQSYDHSLNRLINDIGSERVADLDETKINYFYETKWGANGKFAMGRVVVGKLRMLSTFGSAVLKDEACRRLVGLLTNMRFKYPEPRTERLTAEHANAIRSKAHEMRKPSIAITQAFQFETPLRQLDLIGEWVPIGEPGTSEVVRRREKWLRGLRWSEIDENLVLRRTLAGGRKNQQKQIEVDLKRHPMIMEELFANRGASIDRSALPASGPVVISESTGYPYMTEDFRKNWRAIANKAGVPKTVRNMDNMRADASQELQRSRATIPGKES